MDYLLHFSNILYLGSYLMRDMLWLRVLTVIAGCCLIPYYYSRSEPMMAAIYWNLGFGVINFVQIVLLLIERRSVRLTSDEQRLYQIAFRNLKPREMLRLLKLARWSEAPAGERIVARSQKLDRLILIFAGNLAVEVEGRHVAYLSDGQWVGEVGFLTHREASADVVTTTPTRYVTWDRVELDRFLKNHSELRATFHLLLGVDVATKLRAD